MKREDARTQEARHLLHLNLQLLFLGEIKKGFALRNDILDQGVIDASIGYVKEAYFQQGITEGVEKGGFGIRVV